MRIGDRLLIVMREPLTLSLSRRERALISAVMLAALAFPSRAVEREVERVGPLGGAVAPLPSLQAFREFHGGLKSIVEEPRLLAPGLGLSLETWDRRRAAAAPEHTQALRLVFALAGRDRLALQAALDRALVSPADRERIIGLAAESAGLLIKAGISDPQAKAWIESKRAEMRDREPGPPPASPGLGTPRPEVERAASIAAFDSNFEPEEAPEPFVIQSSRSGWAGSTELVATGGAPRSAPVAPGQGSGGSSLELARRDFTSALRGQSADARVAYAGAGRNEPLQVAVELLKTHRRRQETRGWNVLLAASARYVETAAREIPEDPIVRDVVLNDAALREALAERPNRAAGVRLALERLLPAATVARRARVRGDRWKVAGLSALMTILLGPAFFYKIPWLAGFALLACLLSLTVALCRALDLVGPLRLAPGDAEAVRGFIGMGAILQRDPKEMREHVARLYADLRRRQLETGGPAQGILFLEGGEGARAPLRGASFEDGMSALLRDPAFREEAVETLLSVLALDLLEARRNFDSSSMRALARRLVLFSRSVSRAPWRERKRALLEMQREALKEMGRDNESFLRALDSLLDAENAAFNA